MVEEISLAVGAWLGLGILLGRQLVHFKNPSGRISYSLFALEAGA